MSTTLAKEYFPSPSGCISDESSWGSGLGIVETISARWAPHLFRQAGERPCQVQPPSCQCWPQRWLLVQKRVRWSALINLLLMRAPRVFSPFSCLLKPPKKGVPLQRDRPMYLFRLPHFVLVILAKPLCFRPAPKYRNHQQDYPLNKTCHVGMREN